MFWGYNWKSEEGRRELLLLGILLFVTAAVYAPSLNYAMLDNWDDNSLLFNRDHLRPSWGNFLFWWHNSYIDIYHPLTMFSYMFDYACWGLNALGYRIQSLLWHLAATALAYRCLRLGGIGFWMAWFGAAVFALHPQRVESVAWISERKDVLCAAFYLWTVYRHLAAREPEKFSWAEWGLMVLALLSKPMAVTLPVVLILLDLMKRQRWEWRYYCRRYWGMVLTAAVFVAVASAFQPGPVEKLQSGGRAPAVVLHSYYWVTTNFVWPTQLNPFYSQVVIGGALWLKLAVFAVAVIGLGVLLCRWKRELRYAVPCLALAYVAALAPVAGVFHPGTIDFADRYSYLPSFFLLLLILTALQPLLAPAAWRRHTAEVIGILYLLLMLTLTCVYLPAWKSYYDMLVWSVRHDGTHQMAMVELGLAEQKRRHAEAVTAMIERLEKEATGEDRIDPSSGRFYAAFLRAERAYGRRDFDGAETELLAVYPRLAPKHFYTYNIEVIIYQRLIGSRLNRGDYVQALGYIDQLLKWYDKHRKDFFYHYYSALKAGLHHDWKRAEEELQRAQEFNFNENKAALAAEFQQMLRRCAKVELPPEAKK